MSALVLLKSFFHKHDAEIAMGLLKDGGIEAMLQSDDVGGFRPHLSLSMGNNRIMIQQKDMDKALEIIKPLAQELSDEELKDIDRIAVSKKPIEVKSGKRSKNNLAIVMPVIIGIIFVFSYIFQSTHKDEYYGGIDSENVKCYFVNTGSGEYSVCKEFYKNKNVRWVGNFKGNDADGSSKEFYDSGQLRWEGMYVNNKINGPVKGYFRNGQVQYEETFVNGIREGEQREYFRTGELQSITPFRNNKVHGLYKSYYISGNLAEELEYKNGVMYKDTDKPFEGVEKVFYENGVLWEVASYKKGKIEGIVQMYYENGNLEYELTFKNNELHGVSKHYYEDGQLEYITTQHKDVLISITEYDREGNLIFKGEY